jgi:hypothetical protein
LTLSQNFRIDYVLDVIGLYARRYVLIEFMPLGLFYNGVAPPLPDWYTENWFSEAFSRKFKLIERVQLEPNRVLYVGEVIKVYDAIELGVNRAPHVVD